jgi:hypothetical protein
MLLLTIPAPNVQPGDLVMLGNSQLLPAGHGFLDVVTD